MATTAPDVERTLVEVEIPETTVVETTLEPTIPKPDCGSPCNVVLEGDSLTVGLRDLFCVRIETAKCVNSGVSGARIDEMVGSARTDVDVHATEADNDVLYLWAGTNDLWQKFHRTDPNANVDAVYRLHGEYIDERRANGWDYVFVLTHPPSDPAKVQGVERLNDLIRDNTIGADAVVDIGAEPRLADPFDTSVRHPDAVHYVDDGRLIIVDDYLIPAFNLLIG